MIDNGERHADDEKVIEEHKIVANKSPNDAIRIVRVPAEWGKLVQQYGENGFRLYELPAPAEDHAGLLKPNLEDVDDERYWDIIIHEFRWTGVQNYLEKLRDGPV